MNAEYKKSELSKYFLDDVLGKVVYTEGSNEEILSWNESNNISAVFLGTMHAEKLWYIDNDDERVLFILRWR